MGKLDGKASEMVFGVCKQIEGAVMRSKDVANEQKTETLALGLGREKRSEEILRYSWRDAMLEAIISAKSTTTAYLCFIVANNCLMLGAKLQNNQEITLGKAPKNWLPRVKV